MFGHFSSNIVTFFWNSFQSSLLWEHFLKNILWPHEFINFFFLKVVGENTHFHTTSLPFLLSFWVLTFMNSPTIDWGTSISAFGNRYLMSFKFCNPHLYVLLSFISHSTSIIMFSSIHPHLVIKTIDLSFCMNFLLTYPTFPIRIAVIADEWIDQLMR